MVLKNRTQRTYDCNITNYLADNIIVVLDFEDANVAPISVSEQNYN